MKDMGLHELRREFLDFFEEKNHLIIDSYPLVPQSDKSLLLINAGMAPLKPYFTGEKKPPARRMANCQKCIRTGDIENVGITARHGTFFEMLGNFSFGDYFKKEAIEWAWEFLHERLEIPKEIIWASVYHEDEEAREIWKNHIGMDEEKIVSLGKEDNFWELEVGPCGPSSEIYIDRGEEVGCGHPDCRPGCDCDRFLEVWNLVFTQFDKTEDGEYIPLEHPNIDTGMGLERIAAVLQNTDNIFEVKELKGLINFIEKLTGKKYGETNIIDISIRIITDHVRAMTLLVSDGVLPSNEGRGYVLRRLIRRAARHGKLLGIDNAFLTKIVDEFIDGWKSEFNELEKNREQIKRVISAEEEKFQETIDQGINILEEFIDYMSKKKKRILDGDRAFKLYDTYGFPLDLTKEILEEKNLEVDIEGFNKNMEVQRVRAREARGSSGNIGWKDDNAINIEYNTEFKGYKDLNTNSNIIEIIKDGEKIEKLLAEEEGVIVLDKTPFYGEGGGQIGDTGFIKNDNFKAEVLDTQKTKDGKTIQIVKVIDGSAEINTEVYSEIDRIRRKDIMKNHSATHLLHNALRKVLGDHVSQAGSLVTAERLRFDFTHFEGVTRKELKEIEKIVNEEIFNSKRVEVEEMTLEDSKEKGVIGLFEGKYGEKVRVVSMGESMELCGGTHVEDTADIGMFKIISEGSVASGVRRIEAITGREVYNYMNNLELNIDNISLALKTKEINIVNRIEEILDELRVKDRLIQSLQSKMASSLSDDIIKTVKEVEGVTYITYSTNEMDIDSLRELGDEIKDKLDSYVIVLGSGKDGKVTFVSMVSKDLNEKGIHAGKLIKEVASITGGGGGGRPDMAQAGGRQAEKIDEALASVEKIILDQLK